VDRRWREAESTTRSAF
jgi:dGTPase